VRVFLFKINIFFLSFLSERTDKESDKSFLLKYKIIQTTFLALKSFEGV